jgi:hypothetical protein
MCTGKDTNKSYNPIGICKIHFLDVACKIIPVKQLVQKNPPENFNSPGD